MGHMPAGLAFTLSEAAQVLNPPLSERQLRAIVSALGWQPDGHRHTGRRGHPHPTYNVTRVLELHAALVPFMGP